MRKFGPLIARARRGFWLVLVPVLLTGVFLRYLAPGTTNARMGTLARTITQLAHAHAVLLAVGLFFLFAALAGYWWRVLGRDVEPQSSPRAPKPWQAVALAASVAIAAVLALVTKSSLVESHEVVSTSMLPTLAPGDHLATNKAAYGLRIPGKAARVLGRSPRRGDVIVFRAGAGLERSSSGGGLPTDLVKRVIGLPGDHVTMENSRPVLNGKKVPSCDAGTFVYARASRLTRGRLAVEYLDDAVYLTVQEPVQTAGFVGYEVGPDEVFVLGDNRGTSNDSRSWNEGRGGGVPLSAIDGRISRILYGTGRDGRIDFRRLFRPLGLDVHLPRIDVRQLEAGIARCLKNPPKV